jgi:MFS transporter, DHA1 family, inner membrane transport protein
MSTAGHGLSKLSLASAISVGILGALTIWLVPGLVRLFADHAHLDVRQVGYVTAWDVNAMAVSIGCTTFLLQRVSWRSLALLGLALIAAGSLWSAGAHAYLPLIASRVMVGVGEGLCIGVSFAAFGRATVPSRAFSIYMISGASISASILLALPTLQTRFGTYAIFVGIAALAGVAAAGIRWFPNGASVGTVNTEPGVAAAPTGDEQNRRPPINWPFALVSLGVVFLFFFAQGSVWSYFARIGDASGIAVGVTSRALAAGTLSGILGASLAGLLSTRIGRGWPILLSGAVSILSYLLLLGHVVGGVLILAAILLVAAWNFTQPLLSGLCSDADPHGRVVCAMGCVQTVGFGCGPAAAAMLFDGDNFSPVIWLGTLSLIASLALLLLGLRSQLPSPVSPAPIPSSARH